MSGQVERCRFQGLRFLYRNHGDSHENGAGT